MKIELQKNGIKSEIESFGAYVNTLSKNGVDVFFPKIKIDENGKEKIRGGSHPCLPHFGVSEKVGLPNHGFARDLEWNIETKEESRVLLSLSPNLKDWEGMYAEIEYKIEEDSFSTKLTVRNNGKEDLEISPAFHPYFNYTDENEIYINSEKFEMNKETLPNSLFTEAIVSMKTSDYEIEIKNDNLSKFVIWTNFTDKYLCVEPSYNWQALNNGEELLKLKSGEVADFEYTLRMK